MPVRVKRGWVMGVMLFVLAGLVWWFRIFSPLQEESAVLEAAIQQKKVHIEQMENRLKRLADAEDKRRKTLARHTRLAKMVSTGQSLEEVNAETQLWVQELMEKLGITLRTYKEMPPAKWRSYQVGMIQSQLSASIQDLSDLLHRIEKVDKAVRLEALTVVYRKSKDNLLQVSFDLGTLFLDKEGPKQPPSR